MTYFVVNQLQALITEQDGLAISARRIWQLHHGEKMSMTESSPSFQLSQSCLVATTFTVIASTLLDSQPTTESLPVFSVKVPTLEPGVLVHAQSFWNLGCNFAANAKDRLPLCLQKCRISSSTISGIKFAFLFPIDPVTLLGKVHMFFFIAFHCQYTIKSYLEIYDFCWACLNLATKLFEVD